MIPERNADEEDVLGNGAHRVAVVVVNWNGGERAVRSLRSVCESALRPWRVWVVDNGSVDGSPDLLARDFPDWVMVRNPDNRGFAAACNQGMRAALEAGADFVFLFNNDAELAPDALTHLVAAARRRPGAGLLAGKILYADRCTLWCAGVDVGFYPNLQWLRGHGERDRGQFDREEEVPALTGCALLVRREVLERVGYFDERFFVYVEDVELAIRAAKAGFSSLYVPEAVAYHDASASTGGGYNAWRKYMVAYNVVQLVRIHGSAARWTAFVLFEICAWPALFVISVARGRGRAAWAKARGTWGALLGLPFRKPQVAAS